MIYVGNPTRPTRWRRIPAEQGAIASWRLRDGRYTATAHEQASGTVHGAVRHDRRGILVAICAHEWTAPMTARELRAELRARIAARRGVA